MSATRHTSKLNEIAPDEFHVRASPELTSLIYQLDKVLGPYPDPDSSPPHVYRLSLIAGNKDFSLSSLVLCMMMASREVLERAKQPKNEAEIQAVTQAWKDVVEYLEDSMIFNRQDKLGQKPFVLRQAPHKQRGGID